MSAKYGECLNCGNITGGEEYELCARCAGSPAPAPTEPVTGRWHCMHCAFPVPPESVTYDERHDERVGGCGSYVVWIAESITEVVNDFAEPVTPTEGERERAKDLCACSHCQAIMRPKPISCKAEAIARALAATRQETWEEAAHHLESLACKYDMPGLIDKHDALIEAAAALRAKGGR